MDLTGRPPATAAGLTDDPQAYLAHDRRRALAQGRSLPDRVHGAGLFADISGFTPLTELLAAQLGPQRGAEEVSNALETVFGAVLECLHAYGGDVIYFSGDAVTCWLDGDDGSRAVAAALDMQQAMAQTGVVTTPSGQTVRLGMRVSVAVGPARRFVVGDPRVQRIDVLAGGLVDRLAEADQRAGIGEVVLDASAAAALGDRVVLRERRGAIAGGDAGGSSGENAGEDSGEDSGEDPGEDPGENSGHRTSAAAGSAPLPVVEGLRGAAPEPVPGGELPPLPDDVVRQWLLPAVYERMRSGRGQLLAELRPAVPLFLRFGGIDYDGDPDAARALDDFVRQAQRIVDTYGGSTLQLTLGDKGAYLYAVFGSPVAHEDDAARACAAALELRTLDGTTAARDLSIGIATGRLRSGTYGHATRRTFCCLGDAVNLAARLMSSAAPGEIVVAGPARRSAGERFAWEPRPPLAVKGKAAPVVTFALNGLRAGAGGAAERLAQRFDEPMLGRADELSAAMACVERAVEGQGQVLEIVAEAGLGKSRLLAEVTRRIALRGVPVYVGESPAFGGAASYAAWRDVWWGLLDLPADRDDQSGVTQTLLRRLQAVDPSLAGRLPLLGPLLDLALPDTDLTRDFDAKLRKASLEDLLSTLLVARATRGPVVLAVEDSHWMDPLSQDLLVVLAQVCVGLPVVLVLSHRPTADGDAGTGALDGLAHLTRLSLDVLGDDVVATLVDARVRQVHDGVTPAAVVGRIVERAQGNPFYVEELVGYVVDRAGGRLQALDADALELPDSLSALVLSRIDTLHEGPRSAVKVASVVGRSFTAALLSGVHPDLGPAPVVDTDLDAARAAELVVLDDPVARMHAFRHVIVRDVAYESMPFGVRSRLHERAGDHLGATEVGGGDQLLDLLAYHYGRGGDAAKKRTALLAAARAAQARYANAAAIAHYRDVLPLLDGTERSAVLLSLGQVLWLTGAWAEAEQAYEQARAAASATQDASGRGWAEAALAEVARRQGRLAPADDWLAEAGTSFASVGDEVGRGRVLHLRGTLAAQQGRYDEARAHYRESLALRERLGDRANAAALLSNLAVIAEYTEDFEAAHRLNEEALALRTEIGDRLAIGVSQNNLGMIALLTKDFDGARARFTESMRLNLEVGDAWMVAIARHNLANAFRGLGDLPAARRGYAQALEAMRRWDDAWALAILFEDVAVAAARSRDRATALRLVGAAEAARAALGSPRTPSVEAELTEALGPVASWDQDAALAEGRLLDIDAAARVALGFCLQAG